jgi:hypothetical protein
MSCLDDADDSIRLRALDLLSGMVSKKNLMEIVKKLMSHMAKAEGTTYRFVVVVVVVKYSVRQVGGGEYVRVMWYWSTNSLSMFSLVVRTGFSLLFSNMSWIITAALPTLYELISKSLLSMSSGRRIFHGLLVFVIGRID